MAAASEAECLQNAAAAVAYSAVAAFQVCEKYIDKEKKKSFISTTATYSGLMICNLTLVVAAVRKRAVAASSDAVASFAASSALAHRQRADEVGRCD